MWTARSTELLAQETPEGDRRLGANVFDGYERAATFIASVGISIDEGKNNLQAIPGLYAVGNAAVHAFGGSYPGAGATLGNGVVFGYLADLHALAPA